MANIVEVKHPGVFLEEEINKLGISINEFSTRTLIPLKTLNKLIKGEANLNVDVAKKIASFFNTDVVNWMNLQTRYEEYLIDIENYKNIHKEIEVLKYFDKDFLKKVVDKSISLTDKENVVYDLRKKLMVNSLELLKSDDLFNIYKDTAFKPEEKIMVLQNAFISYAYSITNYKRGHNYDYKENTNIVDGLKKLTLVEKNQYQNIIELLKNNGINVAVVPYIKDSNIASFVRFLPRENSVIIGINDKTNDAYLFLYNILVELSYTYRIHKNLFKIVYANEPLDDYAKRFANFTIIDGGQYDFFVSIHDFSAKSLEIFCKKFNIAKYIVVGRLRQDKLIKQADLKKENKEYKF